MQKLERTCRKFEKRAESLGWKKKRSHTEKIKTFDVDYNIEDFSHNDMSFS